MKGVDFGEEKSPDQVEEWRWVKLGDKPVWGGKIKSLIIGMSGWDAYLVSAWGCRQGSCSYESGLRGDMWHKDMHLGVTFFSSFKGQFKCRLSYGPFSNPPQLHKSSPSLDFTMLSVYFLEYLPLPPFYLITCVLDCRLFEDKNYVTFYFVFSQCLALCLSIFGTQ